MSDFNRINGNDLDRYITGNWGEDSVPDAHPWCEGNCEKDCVIGWEFWDTDRGDAKIDSELDCPYFPEEEKQKMKEAEKREREIEDTYEYEHGYDDGLMDKMHNRQPNVEIMQGNYPYAFGYQDAHFDKPLNWPRREK